MSILQINEISAAVRPTPQIVIPREEENYMLPAGMTKHGAIGLITTALRILGANSTTIEVYRLIADTTLHKAWHDAEQTAICWRAQTDMAAEQNIGSRQWRRIENELQEFGALARVTAENGWRGKSSRSKATFGLSLEPSIANMEVFRAICEWAENQRSAEYNLKDAIRRQRRRLRELLKLEMITPNPAQVDLIKAPAQNHGNISDLLARLTTLNAVEGITNTDQITSKMSGAPDKNVRCHSNLTLNQEKERKELLNFKAKNKNQNMPPELDVVDTENQNCIENEEVLNSGHMLNLAQIQNPWQYFDLGNWIKEAKIGTMAETKDVAFIWQRFCECNARHDRTFVPIAALQGFINKYRDITFENPKKKISSKTAVISKIAAPDLSDGSEWSKVANIIYAEDPLRFKSWFAPMERYNLLDGILTLRAPSKFHANHVENNYKERILANLKEINPNIIEVVFVGPTSNHAHAATSKPFAGTTRYDRSRVA